MLRKLLSAPPLLLPLLLSLLPSGLPAQHLATGIDSVMFENFPAEGHGASVLVARGDSILYHKAFGMASLELKVPMTTAHVFEIGSLTKQFTAVAILMLSEQGKLNLGDSIKKFIPDYPQPAAFVTVHQLLNQTSGIKELLQIREPSNDPAKDYTPPQLIAVFKNYPLRFAPGEKWEYSNSNYAILGYIIEKVSGKTYSAFMKDHLFSPLQMSNTLNGNTRELVMGRLPGYIRSGNGKYLRAPYLNMSYPFAGGSLLSTTSDLFLWSRGLVQHKILIQEALVKAITNYSTTGGLKTNYGYGWFINEISGSRTFEHSGGTRGFASHAVYLPKEDVYVVLLANLVNCPSDQIATAIAAIAINKPLVHPPAIELPVDETKSFAGTYKLEDDYEIKVSVEGKRLMLSMWGLKQEIIPFSQNRFFVKGSFTRFEFLRNEHGRVNSIVYENRAEKIKGQKKQ